MKAMLENGLEARPLPGSEQEHAPIEHTNVRGAAYYRSGEGGPC